MASHSPCGDDCLWTVARTSICICPRPTSSDADELHEIHEIEFVLMVPSYDEAGGKVTIRDGPAPQGAASRGAGARAGAHSGGCAR
jgi:hypothetical protein